MQVRIARSRSNISSALTLSLMLAAMTGLSGCGGGSNKSPRPISVPNPPPAPTPSPTPAPTPTPSSSTFAATGGDCDGTAGWQAIANDGLDDTAAIQTSFRQAANKGDTLTIPAGTYNIDDPAGVTAIIGNKDFAIVAVGAVFVAGPDVNSDLIDFDVQPSSFSGSCGGNAAVDISWTGGELDISRAHLSGTVPQGTSVGATTVGSPVAGTADGLSIRGVVGGSSSLATSPPAKLGDVTIGDITIVGAPISEANRAAYLQNPDTAPAVDSVSDTWRNAGGDSGLFILAAKSALVENSTFYGIRDASIYLSAAPYDALLGGDYVLRGNRFYGGFDGISSKRGAQNIRMEGNIFVNVVRGVSLESLTSSLRDNNSQTAERIVQPVLVANNIFNGVQRAIQLESANNVTVDGNVIRNLGARVAQQNNPVRYARYEGIVLEGVTNASIAGNSILGVGGSRTIASNTVGIVVGSHDGVAGPIASADVDIAASNVFENLDGDVE